ncbi:MAG TPA: hypothetical protein VIP77_16890 [Jiangellaceae bacterium]
MADRRAPGAIKLSVILLAIWWVATLGMLGSERWQGGQGIADLLGNSGLMAGTITVAVILVGLWRGGPLMWWIVARFAVPVGAVVLLMLLFMRMIVSRVDNEFTSDVVATLSPVIPGLLLIGGLLLYSRPARAWCGREGVDHFSPGPAFWRKK